MEGSYTVTITNASGCTATASTFVDVNGVNGGAGSNSPVCVGQTLQLSASGGTSYSWSGLGGYNSSSQNPSRTNVTSSMAGVYTVTILNGGCSATYTVSVVVNQATASASSNSPVCSGNSLNLSATGGGSSYSWLTRWVYFQLTNPKPKQCHHSHEWNLFGHGRREWQLHRHRHNECSSQSNTHH
ncbi:MAG: hypothetical protein U0Y10_02100 [Spirosomataceae bacterium]